MSREQWGEDTTLVNASAYCIGATCLWVLQDRGRSNIDRIIHKPVCLVGKLEGVEQWSCDVLQVAHNTPI